MNSVSARRPDVVLEVAELAADARRRPPRAARTLSRTPASSISRSTRTSGSSMSSISGVSPRSSICSRCHAASSRMSTASAAAAGSAPVARPALLDELAQRERAPRRLEQVRAEQRVVGQARRHDAERLGVVRGDRAARRARRRPPRGRRTAPYEHLRRPSPRRSVRRSSAGTSSPSGVSRRLDHDRRPPRRPAARRGRRRVASRTRRRRRCARPAAAARPRRRRRAPPRAGAAGRAARTRGRSRAAASGRASRTSSSPRSSSTGTSRCAVASCLEIRASSAWLGEVLLALGAGDLVDRVQHALEVAELLEQLRGGLVADPGDAGDVVRRVALEAVEVGDQLGRRCRSARRRPRGRTSSSR